MQNRDNARGIDKLRELTKDIPVAMLTTISADGGLRSRPMATVELTSGGELWFLTSGGSEKAREIAQHMQVNISYVSEADSRYVSVSGSAQILHDRSKAEELWNPTYRAWFPGGLDDPNLAVLKVTVKRAEYWDAPSSRMVRLYGVVKSLVTGQPYESAATERIDISEL